MKVQIVRSDKYPIEKFSKLNSLLTTYSSPIRFEFLDFPFKENVRIWKRSKLYNHMIEYRKKYSIPEDYFLIFLATRMDEYNWFSFCFPQWDKNIFIGTSEWDLFVNMKQEEYPLAYEIVENLLQCLMFDSYKEYEKLLKHKTIGCINDLCETKTDIIFKLRTADICVDCMKIIEKKVDQKITEQFIEIIETIRFQFLHSKKNFTVFQRIIVESRVKIIKDLKFAFETLINNDDTNEKTIQDWIDEENGVHRNIRCLIFGIEYVNPKREGRISNKRFDILAEQNLNYHVIIELKSPKSEIFEIDKRITKNEGHRSTYKLSKDLAKGIPQVLKYKEYYNKANSEQIQELGISNKKEISECIIVIGRRKSNDDVWQEHYKNLIENVKIRIYTYDDLIDKLSNTIFNLENTLYPQN